jgi:hypothetical protein
MPRQRPPALLDPPSAFSGIRKDVHVAPPAAHDAIGSATPGVAGNVPTSNNGHLR